MKTSKISSKIGGLISENNAVGFILENGLVYYFPRDKILFSETELIGKILILVFREDLLQKALFCAPEEINNSGKHRLLFNFSDEELLHTVETLFRNLEQKFCRKNWYKNLVERNRRIEKLLPLLQFRIEFMRIVSQKRLRPQWEEDEITALEFAQELLKHFHSERELREFDFRPREEKEKIMPGFSDAAEHIWHGAYIIAAYLMLDLRNSIIPDDRQSCVNNLCKSVTMQIHDCCVKESGGLIPFPAGKQLESFQKTII